MKNIKLHSRWYILKSAISKSQKLIIDPENKNILADSYEDAL